MLNCVVDVSAVYEMLVPLISIWPKLYRVRRAVNLILFAQFAFDCLFGLFTPFDTAAGKAPALFVLPAKTGMNSQ